VRYDPEERRETPLSPFLRRWIAEYGPIPVSAYMGCCLWHEQHGYYVSHDPIGAGGDFTTAPEISQIFGELIGLWMAAVWEQMGRPSPVAIVEGGPGRGALIRDALRAARLVPEFLAAARLVLAEASPRFEATQRQLLADLPVPVTWTSYVFDFSTPAIVIANEFFDAWPVDQYVKTKAGWMERGVGLDETGNLAFMPPASANFIREFLDEAWPRATAGDVAEGRRGASFGCADELASRAANGPLAALFIDYGHTSPALGDTLQAVRNHKYEHPLCSPGEADLSAQVDFANFADDAHEHGLAVDGPVTQAEFLGSLGIMERASRLMAANPSQAAMIEAGAARLMAPNGMGTRFKAMGVRTPGLGTLPGF